MLLNEYKQWRKELAKTQLVHWEDLPTMNLYVDQLVSVVNDQLTGLHVGTITKSMINNYVKKGVIMAPVKKKYSAYQLAAVTVIALLKNTYSLDDIKAGFAQLTVNDYPKAVYNRFVDLFNALLCEEPFPKNDGIDEANEALLQLVVKSAYQRVLAVQLFTMMNQQQPPAQLKD